MYGEVVNALTHTRDSVLKFYSNNYNIKENSDRK